MHASDTALLAFQDVRVPADALLGEEGKGFYHIMWELQGERLIGAAGCVAAAQKAFDRTLALRDGAPGVRAPDRPLPGDPPQVRRAWRRRSRPRGSSSTRPPGASPTASTPCARSRWPSCYAARMACEVTDECLQIHGGAGYMKRVRDRARVARHAPQPDRRRHGRDHARRDRPQLRLVSARGASQRNDPGRVGPDTANR